MRNKVIHVYSITKELADKKLSEILKSIKLEENTIYRSVWYEIFVKQGRFDYAYIDKNIPENILKEKILDLEINNGGYEFY